MTAEEEGDPLGMRAAVLDVINSVNPGGICSVLQRFDTSVRAGTLDRRRAAWHASIMTFCCNGQDHTLLGHVVRCHELCLYNPEGSSCLRVLLSWGTCPHVVRRCNAVEPCYVTPYRYRHRLLAHDLNLLLASGCHPADLAGVDYMESFVLKRHEPRKHNEPLVAQWFRWHSRHRKRYWVAVSALVIIVGT